MNSHVENQTNIFDLPDDIIHNHISKYLLEDKKINKIFHDQEDNELNMYYLVKLKSFLILLDMKEIHTKYKMMYLKHT
jgi:hypothetical protein